MNNPMRNILFGMALGALMVALPPLLDHRTALVVSRALDDCGIRVAADVTGATISNAVIVGHQYGVCVD